MATQNYTVSTQVFYDNQNTCYKPIIVIDRKPLAPLSTIVKTLYTPKLSPFQQATPCSPIKSCVQAIYNPENTNELLTINELSLLFSFLTTNGYTIDTDLTNMLNNSKISMSNKLICFISI